MLTTAYVLVVLCSAGIIYVGASYLLAPHTIAPGFGLRSLPENAGAFYNIKGVRDIASGLMPLALLLHGDVHALGWAVLAEACIPFGDMLIVLRHGGKKSAAFGIHGATAAVMLFGAAILLLR